MAEHRTGQTRPASAGERKLERETGFEPATSTLARSHSTTELFPPARTPKVPHGRAAFNPAPVADRPRTGEPGEPPTPPNPGTTLNPRIPQHLRGFLG